MTKADKRPHREDAGPDVSKVTEETLRQMVPQGRVSEPLEPALSLDLVWVGVAAEPTVRGHDSEEVLGRARQAVEGRGRDGGEERQSVGDDVQTWRRPIERRG